MNLPRPHILFDKPFKAKLFDNEPDELITGVYKYFDSVLVSHSGGYTDVKYLPGETVGRIESMLKEIK